MPNLFVPLSPGTSLDQLIAIINNNFAQLDNNSVTNTFKQANGNAIVEGKLPYNGGYGSMYFDTAGNPSGISGILPDGTMGTVWAKAGADVTTLFS